MQTSVENGNVAYVAGQGPIGSSTFVGRHRMFDLTQNSRHTPEWKASLAMNADWYEADDIPTFENPNSSYEFTRHHAENRALVDLW